MLTALRTVIGKDIGLLISDSRGDVYLIANVEHEQLTLMERGNGLSASAAALEQRRIMLALEALQFADDRQFDAAMELITLYRHGRRQLTKTMVQIAEDMVDVKFNPGGQSEGEKAGQKNKAESVIRALGSVGVRVNIEVEGG